VHFQRDLADAHADPTSAVQQRIFVPSSDTTSVTTATNPDSPGMPPDCFTETNLGTSECTTRMDTRSSRESSARFTIRGA
jgi:hypothetical protein